MNVETKKEVGMSGITKEKARIKKEIDKLPAEVVKGI